MNTETRPSFGEGMPSPRRWSGRRVHLSLVSLVVLALVMALGTLMPKATSKAAARLTYTVQIKAPGGWNCVMWQYPNAGPIDQRAVSPEVPGGEFRTLEGLLQATPGEKIDFLVMDGGVSFKGGCTGVNIYMLAGVTAPADNTKPWVIETQKT